MTTSNATLLDRYQRLKRNDPDVTVAKAADTLHVSVEGLQQLLDSLWYHEAPRADPADVHQMLVWAGNAMYMLGPEWEPAAHKVCTLATAMGNQRRAGRRDR